VCGMVALITVFFFTYGAIIERKVLDSNTDFLVEYFASYAKDIAPESSDSLKQAIQSWSPPDLQKEDLEVAETNKSTVWKSVIAAISVVVVGAIGIFTLWYLSGNYNSDDVNNFWQPFSITKLLGKNAGLLLVVLITEFLFATLVIRSFRSVDPNIVITNVIDGIQKGVVV